MNRFWSVIFTILCIISTAPAIHADADQVYTTDQVRGFIQDWSPISLNGINQQIRFANEHFNGDLVAAYESVSEVLDNNKMASLKWKNFLEKLRSITEGSSLSVEQLVPSADDLISIRETLLRKVRGRYIYGGENGVHQFARDFGYEKLNKARMLMALYLAPHEYKAMKLVKSRFSSLTELDKAKSIIVNSQGWVSAHTGVEQQLVFAVEHFEGNLREASRVVGLVLGDNQMKALGWKDFNAAYNGQRLAKRINAKDVIEIRDKVLARESNGLSSVYGVEVVQWFAEEFNLHKFGEALFFLELYLSPKEFSALGLSSDLDIQRDHLLTQNPDSTYFYGGLSGFVEFASLTTGGDMLSAKNIMLSALTPKEKSDFGWPDVSFSSVDDYEEIRSVLLLSDENKNLFFRGNMGYALYSYIIYEGDMIKAESDLMALTNAEKVNLQGSFPTTTMANNSWQTPLQSSQTVLEFLESKGIAVSAFNGRVKQFNSMYIADGEKVPPLEPEMSSGSSLMCLAVVPDSAGK